MDKHITSVKKIFLDKTKLCNDVICNILNYTFDVDSPLEFNDISEYGCKCGCGDILDDELPCDCSFCDKTGIREDCGIYFDYTERIGKFFPKLENSKIEWLRDCCLEQRTTDVFICNSCYKDIKTKLDDDDVLTIDIPDTYDIVFSNFVIGTFKLNGNISINTKINCDTIFCYSHHIEDFVNCLAATLFFYEMNLNGSSDFYNCYDYIYDKLLEVYIIDSNSIPNRSKSELDEFFKDDL